MTKPINYAASAQALLEWAEAAAQAGQIEAVTAATQGAHVHATLALVEQQRIANVIALVALPAVHAESLDRYPGVKDQILEALGLS